MTSGIVHNLDRDFLQKGTDTGGAAAVSGTVIGGSGRVVHNGKAFRWRLLAEDVEELEFGTAAGGCGDGTDGGGDAELGSGQVTAAGRFRMGRHPPWSSSSGHRCSSVARL